MNTPLARITAVTALVGFSQLGSAALPNGIAAGDVTHDSVVLWGRTDTAGSLTFEYGTDAALASVLGSRTETVSDPLAPAKWDLSGLSAGTTYYYRVTDSVGAATTGAFKTAATPGQSTGLRFGVSGDWRGELAPYPAIANAATRQLDFFIALGDTIYGDVASKANGGQQQATTLTEFRNKHDEVYGATAGSNTLADLRQSTAIFATIDDHEITNDFAGGADVASDPRFAADPAGTRINDSSLYENGMQGFVDYNPIRSTHYGATGDAATAGETKLYRAQTFGSEAALMVLDARSFRSPGLPAPTNLQDPTQIANYLGASLLDSSRTMLGRQQVEDLKADLLAAQNAGLTWKFVAIPEPIQNLGVIGASDRYEGYAAERTEILKFIDDQNIDNVVFLAADIHGTLVNNLAYQTLGATGIEHHLTNAFEITTGSVAYDAPFGPTIAELATQVGLISPLQKLYYDSLPTAGKEAFMEQLINGALAPLGYDPLGLETGGPVNAQLLQGSYGATHSFGWTEFAIDPLTRELLVTVYGIEPYTSADVANSIGDVLTRTPQVVSQFRVQPVPVPAALWLFASGLPALLWRSRLRRT